MADIKLDFVGPGARLALAAAKRIEGIADGAVPAIDSARDEAVEAVQTEGAAQIAQATTQRELAETAAETSAANAEAAKNGLTPGPRPLEVVAGIYGIVGTVRFVSTYLGPLVRLRRSSDNVERDFYPLAGSDWVDTAEITTWLAGSTASIKTFYDQRGSKNWTQTSNATQPTLTISGTFAWATFTVQQNFQPTAAWGPYTRYKDAVSYSVLAKVDAAITTGRPLFWFSQGTSGTSRRVALEIDSDLTVRGNSTTHDNFTGGYLTPKSDPLTLNTWFRALHRTNFRGGSNAVMTNGADKSIVMNEVVKTPDTSSLSVRINNTNPSGLPISLVGFVAWDRQLTNDEAAYVDREMAKYAPGYVAPTVPSLIRLFGDSRFQEPQIADPNQRIQKVLADSFDPYRRVRNHAVAGTTTAAALAALKAQTIDPTDVVLVQTTINDDVEDTTANHALYISQYQEMYDYMPTGKRIGFNTVIPQQSAVTGTSKNDNITAFNNLLRATFPNNVIELAQAMSTYGGNTTGAPPAAISHDDLHPNALGVSAVVAPMQKAFIVGKGW
ncbi:hypothetical protein GR702_13220 [Novosphingobium sp. FGD1]|uniref:Alpha-L-arabinofuranosidase B catalytic domain-containing protein n=1 Tax=Novosphingobium silvae TaxID=2692619 RepID=A0A7X4K7Y9_9SPHN|nr:arabinofuranosidase catalytic domain-containing protein [Novosphingobium silvae]MYL98724.1 hypothetical protein [Novosphingobium silvae]